MLFYQSLTNQNRLNPLLITQFLEQERDHGFKIYLPSTSLYYQNHKSNYEGIRKPEDIDCRKHGWCDLVVKKGDQINYYKFFTRGDTMSLGMAEKWNGLDVNHRVVLFEAGSHRYVDVSMDYFSRHYSLFATKRGMELLDLNCFPNNANVKCYSPKKFNIRTYVSVKNTIQYLNIRPHEYLKYKSAGFVWNLWLHGKTYSFCSGKKLYDFMVSKKLYGKSYKCFRVEWNNIEKIGYYITKDVKEQLTWEDQLNLNPQASSSCLSSVIDTINNMPLSSENKSESTVVDSDGHEVSLTNEAKALATNTSQENEQDNNNEEHTDVTLSNKSVVPNSELYQELIDYGMDLQTLNDLDYEISKYLRGE